MREPRIAYPSTSSGYSWEAQMLMRRAPRFVRLAVHIALVSTGALLLFVTAAMAEPGQSRASSDNTIPSGLVVVRHVKNSPQKDRALERALNNPLIGGVGFQIEWRDIEPLQGKPDWSKLDELFTIAESSKKWAQVCIYPSFFAPAWALKGVKSEKLPVPYGPDRGRVLTLPMPWDMVYFNGWFAFLKQLSDRYGKSPAFRIIVADGPTSVSEEMCLQTKCNRYFAMQSRYSNNLGQYHSTLRLQAQRN